MTQPIVSAVVYAKDLQRVAGFYEVLLGLRRVEADAGFVVLAGDGIDFIVVQAPAHIADDIVIEAPPALREETPIKLSFHVESIDALRPLVASTGGVLHPAQAAWSWRGAIHLDGCDPEGNIFQLRQTGG